MAKTKPWRDFELLLTSIHQKLAPGARVAHNKFLVGRSGRRRQVDILISQMIGLYETRIVVECKRHARLITIDKIEAFAAKLTDLGVDQGVMVSRNGFDAGAKASAQQHRITLLTYREATALDWADVTKAGSWLALIASKREVMSVEAQTPDKSFQPLSNTTLVFPQPGTALPSSRTTGT
jgi:hypothetical protein